VNRFNLIQKISSEEENVLLLDAGDIFQGTPYFNMFGGVIEMKVMSKMGYDAATMGNHDFDGGMDGFLKAKEYADFPFLCSNYDFSETILKNQTQDLLIKEIGGLKVGIFGIGVELKGLVPDDKFGETVYLDPVENANRVALELKKKGCDLIICLSHLGYQYESDKISDLKLAAATKNIHLIIGGHTHTFLDKPTEVKNSEGQIVLVNQVGWGGIHLGRIDFDIEMKRFNRKQVVEIQ
jgi:5'-nucleotidase